MSWTGPDVAYPQGSIDWPAVAGAHEFAITRINDGTIRDNQWTEARVKAMDASALRVWGSYTFGEIAAPQNQERGPVAELALCMKFAMAAKWKWPGHLPVAYDYEGMSVNGQSPERCADHVMGWLRSYVGRELGSPGLYTTPSDWQRIFPYLADRDKRFLREHVWLWLASWGVTNPDPIPPFDEVFVHQHTSTGRSPGINGAVDLNRLLVEPQRLLALTREPLSKPTPKPPPPSSGGTPAPKPEPKPVSSFPGTHRSDHPFRRYWNAPWTFRARHSGRFKRFCWDRGFVSPHFTRAEWASKDGVAVPDSLRKNAQRQGFRLEQVRHYLGDRPLPGLSYYRSPAHNRAVGGASQSRHMSADATDFARETVDALGRAQFRAAAEKFYANSGVGSYPGGAVHFDARPWRARWSSW